MAVSLDIANAFNSLPWDQIDRAITGPFSLPAYLVAMIKDYLSSRVLEWRDADGETHRRRLSCGVLQGSVLGPLLWNLAFNRVLRTPLPPAVTSSATRTILS